VIKIVVILKVITILNRLERPRIEGIWNRSSFRFFHFRSFIECLFRQSINAITLILLFSRSILISEYSRVRCYTLRWINPCMILREYLCFFKRRIVNHRSFWFWRKLSLRNTIPWVIILKITIEFLFFKILLFNSRYMHFLHKFSIFLTSFNLLLFLLHL